MASSKEVVISFYYLPAKTTVSLTSVFEDDELCYWLVQKIEDGVKPELYTVASQLDNVVFAPHRYDEARAEYKMLVKQYL